MLFFPSVFGGRLFLYTGCGIWDAHTSKNAYVYGEHQHREPHL